MSMFLGRWPCRRRDNNSAQSHQARLRVLEDADVQSGTGNTHLRDSSVLVLGLVKNVTPHLAFLKAFVADLRCRFGAVKFAFLTNNNRDGTEAVMRAWQQEEEDGVWGVYADDVAVHPGRTGVPSNRTRVLARLRNRLYAAAVDHFGRDFAYLVCLDTDLVSRVPIDAFMRFTELREDWDVVCGNGTLRSSAYHYDAYALRLLDDPTDPNAVFPGLRQFIATDFRWLHTLHIFRTWYRVRAAWGGVAVLRGSSAFAHDVLWKEDIPDEECEHASLADRFPRVYVNPHLRYDHDYNLEGVVYPPPSVFSDGSPSFATALCRYVRMLATGARVYLDAASWTGAACFEPPVFFDGDRTIGRMASLPRSSPTASPQSREGDIIPSALERQQLNAIWRLRLVPRGDLERSAAALSEGRVTGAITGDVAEEEECTSDAIFTADEVCAHTEDALVALLCLSKMKRVYVTTLRTVYPVVQTLAFLNPELEFESL